MCQADDRFASLEQQAAEFAFQRLDCAGQRWLRDTAASRGSGEALLLTQREEVGNLVRLDWHPTPLLSSRKLHRIRDKRRCDSRSKQEDVQNKPDCGD